MQEKNRFNQNTKKASLIAKALYSVFTMPITLQAHGELNMFLLRLRTRRVPKKWRTAADLMVNLGCGTRGKPGWVNIDGRKLHGIDLVGDIRKRIPLPNSCARILFSEHVMEHLDYHAEVPGFLQECLRVLQSGGIFRVIVPDAGKYLHAYCNDGWNVLSSIRPLDERHVDMNSGIQYENKMELINEVFRQGFEHKYAYDAESLENVLTAAGFREVKQLRFGVSSDRELAIDAEERQGESLYVEGVKP